MSHYSRLSSASTASWQEPDDPACQLNFEELVEEEKEEKNWKGIGIALLVIVIVFSCVSVAVIIVTPEEAIVREGDKLKLEELVKGEYEPYVVEPRWSKDGRHLMYKTKDNELVYFECDTNFSTVFLDSSPFNEFSTKQYIVSADRSFILFPYHSKRISEHLSLTKHKLYDTDTRLSRDLHGPHGQEFQYVTWTKNGQGLVVVQKNNIYFKDSFAAARSPYMPITGSGEEGKIYNGVPDWLYSAEILKSDNAIWLSPNDDFLVYIEFNDIKVEDMSHTTYENPTNLYPDSIKQKYPKFGTTNPSVRLKIYNFRSNMTLTLSPPPAFKNRDHYITSVAWRNNASFAVVWMNREQNTSIITICDAAKAFCYENLATEVSLGWMDAIDTLVFTPSGSHYFISIPRRDSNGKLVKQVLMVDATVNINVTKIRGRTLFLSTGDIEVENVVGYFNNSVYVIGVPLASPSQRHLYRVTTDKDSPNFHQPFCITCDINENCTYVNAKFGPTGQYYILECLGPGVPYYSFYATPDTYVTSLEDNSDLERRLSEKLLPKNEFLNISLPDGNFVLSKLILPPVLDLEELIQYNVIVVPNDDTGEQTVTDKFYLGWEHFLSSFHSIIIAKIDTSGSSGRGENWRKAIYRNIGAREVDEILAVVRSLKSVTYVNEVMGIVGKGYGGHLALSTLSSDFNDVLSCGVAVTPVIDYSYMDSFVTERYYEQGGHHITSHNEIKLLKNIKNMHRHHVLLMHGTLNDKIHFQNTAQYIKALIAENIRHDIQIYPDSADCLEDPRVRQHVITSIENFFVNCFGIDPNAEPTYYKEYEEEE
ncbi:inactive dipeptidyl peptidase 10-like [Mercenaria mercenaria]|uniref:inactive dipeptidyl peptidase 10-like n=1 Tax=Mercenaria mercenaria TaxID=6596 RepID=UPI00234F3BB1|nr:inactive dipeptidyl peptidase 10-like [Mercenaria mercenaria]